MVKYLPYLLIGVLSGFGGFGLAYMIFKKDKPLDPIIDYHKIDSLMRVNNIYLDSIADINALLKEVIRDKIKYRTKYDTIVQYKEVDDIVGSLNQIINQGIK